MKIKPASTSNRIRELRQAAGLTLAQLAERMVPAADVAGLQKIETGQRNLTLDWMTRIGDALGVPPAALLDGPPAVSWVPLIGAVAAGNWREAVLNPDGQVPVMTPPRDAFALKAVGDSMAKLVPEDGYVVVDPHARELLDKRVYVAMNGDGETTVKRFLAGPPPILSPMSSNPEHQDIPLGFEPITVIGRVVWVGGAL